MIAPRNINVVVLPSNKTYRKNQNIRQYVYRHESKGYEEQFLEKVRGLWKELHTMIPSPEKFKQWRRRVPNYGCGCSSKFEQLLKTVKIVGRFASEGDDSPMTLDEFKFTVELHNLVNKPIYPERPEFTLEEAIVKWQQKYTV